MLPSMPMLFSSSNDCSIPSDKIIQTKETNLPCHTEKKQLLLINNELQGISFESLPEDERECDDELVLLAENSSVGEKRKIQSQTTPTRKKKKIEAVEPLPEDRVNNDEQANHFATSYFMRAKAELNETSFLKFIALLSSIDENKTNVISLYREMMEVLSNHPDLAEEFIGFLHPHQALELDKFTNYIQFERSWNYFRKIDAFHLNKVYHLLEQHLSNPSITSEAVKNSLLSTFKGHPNISEGLLFLLPDEKPPASSKEDFEDISELGADDTNSWERMIIPEQPSRGRGCSPDACDCSCHLFVPKKFCTFCNIKFSNGQIYVQTGKGLRFAKVTFKGYQQEEALWRLNPTIYCKPVERKRTKSLSHQTKDNSHVTEPLSKTEFILETNKEADKCKASDTMDLPKDAVPSGLGQLMDGVAVEVVLPLVHNEEAFSINEGVVINEITDSQVCAMLENSIEPAEVTLITHVKEDEKPMEGVEEGMSARPEEEDCKICDEVEVGMNIVKEENVECEDDSEEVKESKHRVWTREEDKLILQAFQRQLGTDQTFSRISDLMPNRTVEDIQGRFQVLMNLLEQMTNGSNYPS